MHFCGQVNGHNMTFIITDDNYPDSYMALFPNFAEQPPADRYPGSVLLNDWEPRYKTWRKNPSGRVIPAEYFMFLETPPATLKPVHAPEEDGSHIFQDGVGVAFGFR